MHSADNSRITTQLADENATLALGKRLAPLLKPGMVIYLHGNLGSGKTTLVRGVLHGLGYGGRVKSPTYALLETYQIAGLDLRHFDLYRLHSETEWDIAGFRDEFDGNNIFFIEWPEQALGLIPPADLAIDFTVLTQGRSVTLQSYGKTGTACIKQL